MNAAEITNLLRMAADDELTGAQTEALQSHLASHPEDHEFIAFERRMRAAVARAMSEPAAPASLRAQIESQLHEHDHEHEPLRLVGSVVGASSSAAPARPRRRVFIPSGLAAGFLLLVGTAVVIGITGHADWFDWFRPTQIPISDGPHSLGFPIAEHQLCNTDPQYAQRKFTIHSAAETDAYLRSDLGWDVSAPDLSAFGYTLRDAGKCDAGGSVESLHLRYVDGDATLSVWIEHSLRSELTHSAHLEEGRAYLVTPTDRQSRPNRSMAYFAWRQGEFVYRLVPASAGQAREMATAMGMPEGDLEEIH